MSEIAINLMNPTVCQGFLQFLQHGGLLGSRPG